MLLASQRLGGRQAANLLVLQGEQAGEIPRKLPGYGNEHAIPLPIANEDSRVAAFAQHVRLAQGGPERRHPLQECLERRQRREPAPEINEHIVGRRLRRGPVSLPHDRSAAGCLSRFHYGTLGGGAGQRQYHGRSAIGPQPLGEEADELLVQRRMVRKPTLLKGKPLFAIEVIQAIDNAPRRWPGIPTHPAAVGHGWFHVSGRSSCVLRLSIAAAHSATWRAGQGHAKVRYRLGVTRLGCVIGWGLRRRARSAPPISSGFVQTWRRQ